MGIHAGVAYVGMVGDSVTQFTVRGDTANVGARLSSEAAAGEILISESARQEAGLPCAGELEHLHLELRGRAEPLDVHVFSIA